MRIGATNVRPGAATAELIGDRLVEEVESTMTQSRNVVDFDHMADLTCSPPLDEWVGLRQRGDIPYSDAHGGFLVVSRYDDVCAVARDGVTFASGEPQNTIPAGSLPSEGLPPIHSDPPDHRTYRDILNPYFSPSAVASYEPWIRELAQGYLGRIWASDSWDVPHDLGGPLTRDVTFRVMGIVNAPEEVNRWVDLFVFENDPEATEKLMGFLGDELRARREQPAQDLITGLSVAPFNDRLLADNEILGVCLLMLLAGLETTASTIAGTMWYLLQHPHVAAELAAADASTWRLAIDEFIRWAGPVQALARTAMRAAEVRGYRVDEGERLMMLFGSANRDAEVFDNPDEVILNRYPNRHVSFGMGPHRCLGSHLAKVELRIVLEGLINELDQWELVSPDAIKWQGARVLRSIRNLPVRRVGGTS
jgi:cytochrome P450